MTFSEKNIARIVKTIQYLYLVLGIFACLGFVAALAQTVNPYLSIFFAISALIFFCLFYGLKNKKSWVVVTMIIFNAFMVAQDLFSAFQTGNSTGVIIVRFIDFVLGLFLVFFFTRKEVRAYFKSNGTIIY